MSNKKCPNCGFINFLTAETCRKCETSLDAAGQPEAYGQQADASGYGYRYQPQPYAVQKSSNATLIKVLAGAGGPIVFAVLTGGGGGVVTVVRCASTSVLQGSQSRAAEL